MKVLITGFDPFDNEKINPAWEAITRLPDNIDDVKILKFQIPTAFIDSYKILFRLIDENKPDIVICVGQAGGRFDFTIERVAINIDDARIPDNNGYQPIDVPIFSDGENALFSSLPIKSMIFELNKNNIPASISNTAGTFVCNHIMYSLLYYIKKNNLNIRGGFIHVPYIREQIINKKSTPYMELSTIIEALKISIKTLQKYKSDIKISGGKEF